jgi:maleylacetate reductase
MAVRARRPKGTIIHSDQGCQYGSDDWHRFCRTNYLEISMSRKGLYAQDGNPIMSMMAEEGIRALAKGLRGVKSNGRDKVSREECLYGAWLCGMALGNVGMALQHKLCHTLGGTYNLPHAETHAIVLPHALAYNSVVAEEAMQRISRALGLKSAADGLYDLNAELGVPRGLNEIGLQEADLDHVCEVAMSNPYWNPRPIEAGPLRALLQRAWEGSRPLP